jgi:hypothetical protein
VGIQENRVSTTNPWKENRQMKRTKKKPQSASAPLNIVTTQNEERLRACFAENSQLLLRLCQVKRNGLRISI